MGYVIILIILLNMSIAFSIYFDKRIEETLFLSILGIVLIIFLSGFVFNLLVGVYIIILLSSLLFIYNFICIYKKKKIIKENIFTPSFFFFIVFSIFLILLNFGRLFIVWDEFSHWALVVKNMFYLNTFGLGSDSTVLAKSYLSGTSLFQYFCVKLNGTYNESILYFAQNLMFFSLILPIFKNFKKLNNIMLWLSMAIVVLLPTLFYPYFYNSIYVDGMLGIAFAYSIYSYYLNYENGLDKFNKINLSASILMLIFIKDFGLILSLITIFIILIDNIFIRNKFSVKILLKNSKDIILIYLPAIIIKILWTIELKKNVENVTSSNSLLSSIINLFKEGLVGYKTTVYYEFKNALFFRSLSSSSMLNISFVVGICIFILLYCLLTYNIKKSKLKTSYIFSEFTIILGGLGYALLILIAYLILFSEYEALRLASYERYISTYTLGMLLIIVALIINKYSNILRKNNIFCIISIISLICIINYSALLNMVKYARDSINNTKDIRNQYKKFKSITDKYVKKGDLLYFISTNDDGIDFYIARYELTPNKMNLNYAWSIGNPYNDSDIWTVQISKEDWAKHLINDYNYVYLFDIDEQFISKYNTLFDVNSKSINDNQLYKVEKNKVNEKILKLVSE